MAVGRPEILPEACEVAIVGGGPAGCACALSLAAAGIGDVVLIEAGGYEQARVGECLPPDARALLKTLGVWEGFVGQAHEACVGSCAAWGTYELGYNDFVTNPMGGGWHLNRLRFDSLLADAVRTAGVPLLTHTRFVRAAPAPAGRSLLPRPSAGRSLQLRQAAGWSLLLGQSDGRARRLTARFVVDATGLHSRVARAMGARRCMLDRLLCVYGFFLRPEGAPVSRLTMLEAVEDGWWYKAALPDGGMCIALACDAEGLRRGKLNHWRSWLERLAATRHVARGLAGYRFLKDEMRVMPAPSYCLDDCRGEGWIAVGDAASAFDPLMSRGILKALQDGIHAGGVVARWIRNGPDDASDYRQELEQRFAVYSTVRKYLYAQEIRWPEAAFWRRRLRAPDLVARYLGGSDDEPRHPNYEHP